MYNQNDPNMNQGYNPNQQPTQQPMYNQPMYNQPMQQPMQQPMYNQAMPVQGQKTNGMCIAGLVCAFLCFPIGIILSVIGIISAKNNGQKGKGLAIAGIIISLIPIVCVLLFSLVVWPSIQNNIALTTACSMVDNEGNYESEDGTVVCRDFTCEYKDGGLTLSSSCNLLD